jgi:uncharacterized membrane protein
VGLLSSLLGFGVTIVAALLIYRLAYSAVLGLVEAALGGATVGALEKWFIAFLLLFIFLAVGARIGRFARDWIDAGKRVVRRPAGAAR